MDAKLCLCVMLIILGTLSVQGAAPRNVKKISLGAFAGYPDSRSHAPLGAIRTDDDDVAADPAACDGWADYVCMDWVYACPVGSTQCEDTDACSNLNLKPCCCN